MLRDRFQSSLPTRIRTERPSPGGAHQEMRPRFFALVVYFPIAVFKSKVRINL
jgi:hypothetical protein